MQANKIKLILFSLIIMFLSYHCGGHRAFIPPPPIPDDRQQIPEPKEWEFNEVADAFDKVISNQFEQSLDFSRQFRKVFNKPKQAYNVDAFDEVPNSSWFTNRNATNQMGLTKLRRGPDQGTGPDITGKWTVIRAKAEGVTPGFHIKDKRGDRYLIKFDPKGYPELATGAEVISTKLFYAMGYNTPENYITYFYPDSLIMREKVKFTDANGKKRYMTEEDLQVLIARIETNPDGRVRALASKYLPGAPVGPFRYEGIRKDDYNDFIPHQHRRELRALYVAASWLNHTDTKSGNSYDSYITEDSVSYVRHYLIDFGTTFGSAAQGPNQKHIGHENAIDPHAILARTFAFGLYYRDYEKSDNKVIYNSIGLFDSRLFDPGKFESLIPNPAFENKTNRDGYWGAKLVTSFTDEQLEAVIKEGQYSNPEAEAYLLKILKERRDKIGRYWFSRVNPLDHFRILKIQECKKSITNEIDTGKQECNQYLCFDDMMVLTGLESVENVKYRIVFEPYEYQQELITDQTCVNLTNQWANFTDNTKPELGLDYACQGVINIYTFYESANKWSKNLKVYIDYSSDLAKVIGIERQE